MSFNHGFKKILFLPSGGLSYPPYAFIENVTNEITLLLYDKNSSNTEFEYMFQVINKYVKLPVDILELYLFDFYYIWSALLTLEFNDDDKHVIAKMCSCKEVNKISLFFSEHETRIYNKYTMPKIQKLYVKDNIIIEFELRRVKHNIDLQYYTLYNTIKSSMIGLIHYVSSQIISIGDGKEKFSTDIKDIFGYISSLTVNELMELYNYIIDFNETFGIENNLVYQCYRCHKKNTAKIYEDMQLCVFYAHEFNVSKKIEFLKGTIDFLQLNILSIDDIINIPLKDSEVFNRAINEVKIHPRGMF